MDDKCREDSKKMTEKKNLKFKLKRKKKGNKKNCSSIEMSTKI